MHHSESLLFNLVVCLATALIFGLLATRFRFSPIVGYLVAGTLCDPFTGEFVANPAMTQGLADIGVVLLMLGVRLKLNFHELLPVRKAAIPRAAVQSLVTIDAVTAASRYMVLGWLQGLIVGLAQIGEFSFILIRQDSDLKLLPNDSGHLVVAATIVSILLNPFLIVNLAFIERQFCKLRWRNDSLKTSQSLQIPT